MCSRIRSIFIIVGEHPKHEEGEARKPEKADAGTPQGILSFVISSRVLFPSVLMRLFLCPEELLLLPVELLLILSILLVVVVVGPPFVAVSCTVILSIISPSSKLLFEIPSLLIEFIGTPVAVFFLGSIVLVIGRPSCPSRIVISGVGVLFVSLAIISVGMLLLRSIWCMISFP